jgi:hypothetical protein
MTQTKKPAKKAAKKKATTKVNRSARTGKFVTEEFADENPDTTFKDTITRRKKHC